MAIVYLSIGGNIGDSRAVLQKAAATIKRWQEVEDLKLSPLYQTSPISKIEQRDFVNGVVRLETELSPHDLMERCWALEREYGVKEQVKDGPRILDIDLLLYGNKVINDEMLTVPHPRWKERLFVLVPLADLTREVTVGDQHIKIEELITAIEDDAEL